MQNIKPIKIIYRSFHPKCFTHNELEKCTQVKRTNANPDFADKEEIFIEYITSRKKNFERYFVIGDFKIVFHKEVYPHIKPDM